METERLESTSCVYKEPVPTLRFCKEMFKYVYKTSVTLVRYHQNAQNYINAIDRGQMILLVVFFVTVVHFERK